MQNNDNSLFQPKETEIKSQKRRGPKLNPDVADRDWWLSEMIKALKAEGYTNEMSIVLTQLAIDYQILKSKFIRLGHSNKDAHELAIKELENDMVIPHVSESSIKSVYQDYVGPKKDRIENSINSDLDSAVNQNDLDQAIAIYTEVYGEKPIKSRKPRNR